MPHPSLRARRAIATSLALFASAPALQAASLQGRILDPQGKPVANATLRLFDRNSGAFRETRSRHDGAYVFDPIPDGEYLLEGEAAEGALVGSQEATVRSELDQDLALAIAETSSRVVVTASTTPLAVQEVAKAVDTVDSVEIALRNEFSIAEAIRNLPGTRVKRLGGPGSLTALRTRGLRNHDTAVLVDGVRFRDATSIQGDATAFYQAFNVVNADKVEFLRGSGSSLYGSHAIGGAINVRSRQGGGRPHGELLAEGGGLGALRGVGRFGGGLGSDRFAYSGGFSHLDVSKGYRSASPHRNTGGQGFAKYAFTPGLTLSGRVWAADTTVALTESPAFGASILANFPETGPVPARALPVSEVERFEQQSPFDAGSATFIPSQLDPDSRSDSSFMLTALALEHRVSPNSSYRLTYQLLDSGRTYADGPGGHGRFEPAHAASNRSDGTIHTVLARADHRIGGRNLLSFGYDGDDEESFAFNTDQSPSPVTSHTTISQASHSFFAQDQLRLADGRLQVALAVRSQFFNTDDPAFSGTRSPYEETPVESPTGALTGDAAVAYFVRSSQTKLRAHAGNSFRSPSAYERFGGSYSSFSGSFSYYGDPRLAPERSISVDAGLDQWLYSSRLRLSGTFFYTDLQETILFDFANFPANDVFGRFGGYRNGGGGIARGVEVSAQFTPTTGSSVRAAYTATDSTSRTPTIGADFFQPQGLSRHVFTATATQWIAKRFNVTFDLFAAGDYSLSPFGAGGRRMVFPGPVKADLVLRYDLAVSDRSRLEFYGKTENVFNAEYYEDGFGTPGAWAVVGVRFRY